VGLQKGVTPAMSANRFLFVIHAMRANVRGYPGRAIGLIAVGLAG